LTATISDNTPDDSKGNSNSELRGLGNDEREDLGGLRDAKGIDSGNNAQVKAYCLEKALKAYEYNQNKSVLELAKEFEDYLTNGFAD
jgi:hypothetical protein